MLATPIALLTPLPLKIAVDNVIGSKPVPDILLGLIPGGGEASELSLIAAIAVLTLGIALLTGVQAAAAFWLQFHVAERIVLRFQSQLFAHVQKLSLVYHDTRGTGDSLYRIQYDAREVPNAIVLGLIPIIGSVATVLGMVYVTARIDWRLAVVAFIVAPALFLMIRAYGDNARTDWARSKELQSRAGGVVQETLGALRVVKAFGQEKRHAVRFVGYCEESVGAQLRVVKSEAIFGLKVGLILAAGMALLLFVGTRRVQSGALTLGDLLLVMGYLTQLYAPLQTISQKIARLQSALASADRAFALLDELPDVQDRDDAIPIESARGEIAFDHVGFSYDGETRVLDDVTFKLGAGSAVGIVGATGSGKTTLVNLACRFFDPTEGRILLDGTDLRDYRLRDLRKQFSIVLQDAVLFSATIGENISYGRTEATQVEIETAAKAANVHDFISSLPNGYDTEVGERGMLLSGGERQRVSLARAFLHDAPILILDEPTSSVDHETEGLIIEAMGRLMKGRTTFMIAHRLSTLDDCDEVLHVEGGRVTHLTGGTSKILEQIAAGNTVDLLRQNGSRGPKKATRVKAGAKTTRQKTSGKTATARTRKKGAS
ncbi:MAG: ABC transporter ATP-binding protein/permease [Actinomycetota bacterium]|nr:ABC transporter ATP-binding protein/permease [Actinomycetota bacterium]